MASNWHKASSSYPKFILVSSGGTLSWGPFDTLERTKMHAEEQGSIMIIPYTEWFAVPWVDEAGRPQPLCPGMPRNTPSPT